MVHALCYGRKLIRLKPQALNQRLSARNRCSFHFGKGYGRLFSAHVERDHDQADQTQHGAVIATKVGAAVNMCLAGAKGLSGVAVGSTALIADCFNSLGDIFCDAIVYVTVTEARKAPSLELPWGRGKAEPLGALVVGGLLLTTGGGIGLSSGNAAFEIANQSFQASGGVLSALFTTSPSHFVIPESLSWTQLSALGVSGVSISAKELLFRYTLQKGNAANSAAVVANAWQHRADVFVSSAVFTGLVGSIVGFPILDPLAGAFVSGLILKQAVSIVVQSLKDLGDTPASPEETDQLKSTCLSVEGILNVEQLHARQSGPFLFVECNVGVDGSLSASSAHRLAELARKELLKVHAGRVANAVVHVNPVGSSGLGEQTAQSSRNQDEIEEEVEKVLLAHRRDIGLSKHGPKEQRDRQDKLERKQHKRAAVDDVTLHHIISISEVQVYYKDDGRISLKVDVCMNPRLTIRTAHKIAVLARKRLESSIVGLDEVDVDLELFEGSDGDEDDEEEHR